MILKVIGTGSRGNAYVLETDTEALLIEAGVKINEIKKAVDFRIDKYVGCLVTHSHMDHSKCINEVMDLGIDVYATNETLKARNSILNVRANKINLESPFFVGGFKIMAFEVKHDVPCCGFLIDHKDCGLTLFITDTYYCKFTFPGLKNIIIEANYAKEIIDKKYGRDSELEFLRNRILRSHFSLDNCIEMLQANDLSQVNNIVLIHLSDGNSDEKMFVQKVLSATGKNVVAARNGLEMNFKKTPF